MHLSTGLRELKEPGTALAAAVEQRALADLVQDLAVQRAREQDWDWEQIASGPGHLPQGTAAPALPPHGRAQMSPTTTLRDRGGGSPTSP